MRRDLSPDALAVESGHGARVAALLATRRWLLLLLITTAWSLAALVGLAQFAQLSGAERGLLVLGAACVIAAWALGGRTIGLWVLPGAPLCLIVAAALSASTGGTATWIAITVSVSNIAWSLVLLTPRIIGILTTLIAAAALLAISAAEPTNVVLGALAVAGGWIAVATLVGATMAIWFAWHELLRSARAADLAFDRLTQRQRAAIAEEERSRMWRATVATVHERLLSTIRYVLQADELDRSGLAELARPDSYIPMAAADLDRIVREATAARVASGILHIDTSLIDSPLDEAAREPLRAAIVECAQNAVLHGQATEIEVSARREGDRLIVDIADNGSGVRDDVMPGIGWTTVLGENLRAVDGTWSVSRRDGRTIVSISLPDVTPRPALGHTDDGFDQGRILATAPLIAIGVIGLAYDVVLAVGRAWGLLLVIEAVLATAAALVLAVRATRPRLLQAVVVILALAAIPWLIAWVTPRGDTAAVGAAINAAGYALIAVAVWSRAWTWILGLGVWAAGVLTIVIADPALGAAPIIVAAINCLIAVPIVVVVSAIGTRRYLNAEAARSVERERMRLAGLRASTVTLIDDHLSSCVDQADEIITSLAGGAPLDEATRERLTMLDGLIRATLQVDPVTGSAFARLASRLVTWAFGRDRPIDVGTIIASADQRDIPAVLEAELRQVIDLSTDGSIRTFTDGTTDYLAFEARPTDPAFDRAVGRCMGHALEDIEITFESEDDRSLLVVARAVRATG